jgi:hypothetical protein
LFAPHLATGDWGPVSYESELVLVNTGLEAANFTICYFNDLGEQLAATPLLDVPAQGKNSYNLAELLHLEGAATGYLTVTSTEPSALAGSLVFGDARDGYFLSALPLQGTTHRSFLLAHIANGTLGAFTYFTGIAILNPYYSDTTVLVSAFSEEGILQDSVDLPLPGLHRQVFLLDGLMPALTSMFGGYIIIEGAEGAMLSVFELFGNTPLQFLSAVPAIPLPAPDPGKREGRIP